MQVELISGDQGLNGEQGAPGQRGPPGPPGRTGVPGGSGISLKFRFELFKKMMLCFVGYRFKGQQRGGW